MSLSTRLFLTPSIFTLSGMLPYKKEEPPNLKTLTSSFVMDSGISVVEVAVVGSTLHLLMMSIALYSCHRTMYTSPAEGDAEQGLREMRPTLNSKV